MPPEIPEYYRHLIEQKEASEPEAKPRGPEPQGPEPPAAPQPQAQLGRSHAGRPQPGAARRAPAPVEPERPAWAVGTYEASGFRMPLAEGWQDQTVYILAGPSTDGVQHNITVTLAPDVQDMPVVDFADLHIQTLEAELKGCRLLLKEPMTLDSGLPAYRAIFVWWPTDELRLYQEQVYVVHGGRGYLLTASFTKKTRKTLGPAVERMLRSFHPHA